MFGSDRAATSSRWQQSQRKSVPASISDLLGALRRLRGEAADLAELAYHGVQHHSFEPYWTFRAKIDEHAALIAVIRGRLPRLKEMRLREADVVAEAVEREELDILVLTIQSCLKFCFALSANPWLPIGARETFIHEIDALNQARGTLEKMPAEKMPSSTLDDIDTAKMILEEIIEKSPSLADFSRLARRRKAPDEVAQGEEPAASAPAPAPESVTETASLAPG